jgi:hypothetical protein
LGPNRYTYLPAAFAPAFAADRRDVPPGPLRRCATGAAFFFAVPTAARTSYVAAFFAVATPRRTGLAAGLLLFAMRFSLLSRSPRYPLSRESNP